MNSWADDEPEASDSESEDGLIRDCSGVGHTTPWTVASSTIADVEADAHDNLWWYSEGSLWDLGPAALDADADGVGDSLTSEVDGAMAVLTDSTGDGRIDQMSILYDDGQVVVQTFTGPGDGWNPTTLGRLD